MFTISDTRPQHHCQGWTRREFLRVGGLGVGGLTLPGLFSAQADASTNSYLTNKSVVLLFLQGGPPQIETFDPKMDASSEVRSCTGEVQTRLSGITFGGPQRGSFLSSSGHASDCPSPFARTVGLLVEDRCLLPSQATSARKVFLGCDLPGGQSIGN